MSAEQNAEEQLSPAQLKAEIDAGQPLLIVDLRNREDAGQTTIDGAGVTLVNLPYAEYVDDEDRLFAQLPQGQAITFLCGKGGASDYFAGLARERGIAARNLAGGTAAWGDFYDVKPVVAGPELSIWQVGRPARGCLSYVVASRGEAVVVDPLRHIDRYTALAQAQGLKITGVLDTHGHADHISGGRALADELGVSYFLHPYDAIHPLDVLPATIAYEPVRGGQEWTVGSARVQAVHIPGHTLGNLVYLVNDQYLLSGDSIFVESIARPDLGGRGEAWAPLHYESLSSLLALSDETVVLPGHFSSALEANAQGRFARTLGELKQENSGLLKLQEGKEIFIQFMLGNLPTFPPEYVEIKRVNAGLLRPDEEKASELETGRNICALSAHKHSQQQPQA